MKYFLVLLILFVNYNLFKANGLSVNHKSAAIPIEKFSTFFDKFKNDSLFQMTRIENPLTVVTIDENGERETVAKLTKKVKYVSFSPKDWKGKISLKFQYISKNIVLVELMLIDTGVIVEHHFKLRNNKWFLYKIKDLSD